MDFGREELVAWVLIYFLLRPQTQLPLGCLTILDLSGHKPPQQPPNHFETQPLADAVPCNFQLFVEPFVIGLGTVLQRSFFRQQPVVSCSDVGIAKV